MQYAMQYLNTVSWFYVPLSWIFIYRNSLQGLDQGFIPMVSGGLEFAVRYVTIQFFAEKYGYAAVCYADPATWVATAVLLMITYYIWAFRRKKRENSMF